MSLVKQAEDFLQNEKLNPPAKRVFLSPSLLHLQAKRAERRAAARRLVEAAKSPTQENEAKNVELAISKAKFFHKTPVDNLTTFASVNEKTGELLETKNLPFEPVEKRQVTPLGAVGCATVIQYREWSDEYRVRTQSSSANPNPPEQEGERESDMLSMRGAKKIAEACEYMHLKKDGFKTFVTGTFNEETRKKIKLGETTIQREVSRSMDALQKMYLRGWETESGEKIAGHSETLAYVWVVEIPKNEQGDENPHIHMLLGWSVPFRLFGDWSKRLERIWRNGYFHLEKIKDCACAGAYMAKAAGYMTKANGDDNQGVVKGNRYGISESARAPDWVTISKSQLHAMGQLISDIYDHLTVKYSHLYRARKQLKTELEKTPKDEKPARLKIGAALQKVREEIKQIPVRANKYQVILKGMTTASMFFQWAKGNKDGLPTKRPEWLPDDLPKGAEWIEGEAFHQKQSLPIEKFKKFIGRLNVIVRDRKKLRLAGLNTDEFLSDVVEKWEHFKNEAFSGWFEYERLDLFQ